MVVVVVRSAATPRPCGGVEGHCMACWRFMNGEKIMRLHALSIATELAAASAAWSNAA